MKIRYCIECAAPLGSTQDKAFRCTNGHMYWNNPRSAVTLLVLKDDKLLYTIRAHEPARGKYDLPGGFVDQHETAEAAARRELQEETGLRANALSYVGSVANDYLENIYTCDSIFVVTDWEGTPQAADDAAELIWASADVIGSEDFAWTPYAGVLDTLKIELQKYVR